MKRRRAALSRSGETPDEEPSRACRTADMNGRVNWKMLVATMVICLVMKESGVGSWVTRSWERRCWTGFSSAMLVVLGDEFVSVWICLVCESMN